jgi:hypothetical protein
MQRARQWLTFFTLSIALAAVPTPAWGQQGGMSGMGPKPGMPTKRPPASSPAAGTNPPHPPAPLPRWGEGSRCSRLQLSQTKLTEVPL